MTDNIVKFGGKDAEDVGKLMMVCGACGCLTHYITGDHRIECANCAANMTPETGEWRAHLPDIPKRDADIHTTEGLVSSTVLGNVALARKRVLKRITNWEKDNELALIVGYALDGAGSHWVNVETQEQKEWMIRKLQEVLKWVEKMDVDQ